MIHKKALYFTHGLLLLSVLLITAGCKSKPMKKNVSEKTSPVKLEGKIHVSKPKSKDTPLEMTLIKRNEIKTSFIKNISKESPVKSVEQMTKGEKTQKRILAVSRLAPPSFKTSPFLSDKSFVTHWTVLGPFKYSLKDLKKPSKILEKEFIYNENCLDGNQKAPDGTSWVTADFSGSKPAGKIDLNKLFKNRKNVLAYAVANIDVPRKLKDLTLCAGSCDLLKIWINGKLVHTYDKYPRKSDWDQDIINNISLIKGNNAVVVKCVKTDKNWDFFFRLTNKDGMPLCVSSASK